FAHWLKIGQREGAKLPKIFFVNWFRKDKNGKFIWPGFGENTRVLKYIVDRLEGKAQAVDTAIGRVPAKSSIDISGLGLSDEQMDTLLGVDHEVWREEAGLIPAFFEKFGDRLPKALWGQHEALVKRLG
ncbi:MAG: phosphoenolpyruvate carboxykinase (GTP), partial [Alphaproteobacteria bacterium]